MLLCPVYLILYTKRLRRLYNHSVKIAVFRLILYFTTGYGTHDLIDRQVERKATAPSLSRAEEPRQIFTPAMYRLIHEKKEK